MEVGKLNFRYIKGKDTKDQEAWICKNQIKHKN